MELMELLCNPVPLTEAVLFSRASDAACEAYDAHLFLTSGQAANCDAKALCHRLDRAAVLPISTDRGISVQQGIAGHLDMVKPDLAIVHPIQPHLGAIVQNPDPRGQLAVVVSDADHKDVWSFPFAVHRQLCKDSADLQSQRMTSFTNGISWPRCDDADGRDISTAQHSTAQHSTAQHSTAAHPAYLAMLTCPTNPELGGCVTWSVNNEAVAGLVIRSLHTHCRCQSCFRSITFNGQQALTAAAAVVTGNAMPQAHGRGTVMQTLALLGQQY